MIQSLTLPWPVYDLWPNARPHRMAKAKLQKAQRFNAMLEAKAAKWVAMPDGGVDVYLRFHRARGGPYDLDGGTAALKGALDGLSDIIGVNDSLFHFTVAKGAPVAGGAVRVFMRPRAPGPVAEIDDMPPGW